MTTQSFITTYIEYLRSVFLGVRVFAGVFALFGSFFISLLWPVFAAMLITGADSLIDAYIIVGTEVFWFIFIWFPLMKALDDTGHIDRIGERLLMVDEDDDQ